MEGFAHGSAIRACPPRCADSGLVRGPLAAEAMRALTRIRVRSRVQHVQDGVEQPLINSRSRQCLPASSVRFRVAVCPERLASFTHSGYRRPRLRNVP